jgi:hypothetical protein
MTRLLQKLYFSTFYATYYNSKRETHIHDISNTYMYVSFPQLFAKGKSLKSVGIEMPRDKYVSNYSGKTRCLSRKWDNILMGRPKLISQVSLERLA